MAALIGHVSLISLVNNQTILSRILIRLSAVLAFIRSPLDIRSNCAFLLITQVRWSRFWPPSEGYDCIQGILLKSHIRRVIMYTIVKKFRPTPSIQPLVFLKNSFQLVNPFIHTDHWGIIQFWVCTGKVMNGVVSTNFSVILVGNTSPIQALSTLQLFIQCSVNHNLMSLISILVRRTHNLLIFNDTQIWLQWINDNNLRATLTRTLRLSSIEPF